MRRRAPRSLAHALGAVADAARPASALARVQSVWPAVAGARVAREATPVSERAGTVTIACTSAVWAHELDLLRDELLARLAEELGGPPEAPGGVRALRFVVRG